MNQRQMLVIAIVNEWVKENKEPISLREIVRQQKDQNPRTIRACAETLCKKGYLRRSYAGGEVSYVRLRSR
jgi:SOS-response transcriptional repressor LexA